MAWGRAHDQRWEWGERLGKQKSTTGKAAEPTAACPNLEAPPRPRMEDGWLEVCLFPPTAVLLLRHPVFQGTQVQYEARAMCLQTQQSTKSIITPLCWMDLHQRCCCTMNSHGKRPRGSQELHRSPAQLVSWAACSQHGAVASLQPALLSQPSQCNAKFHGDH